MKKLTSLFIVMVFVFAFTAGCGEEIAESSEDLSAISAMAKESSSQNSESTTETDPSAEDSTSSDEATTPETPDSVDSTSTNPPPVVPSGKLIALTFDDGPHPTNTARLLDFLKEEDVKVTFFVLGWRAKNYPDLLNRAYIEGHQIGNHTYNHKKLTTVSDEILQSELDSTNEVIFAATGAMPNAIRPPFGAYNDKVVAASGMPVIMWTVDPRDWETKDAELTREAVVTTAKDGSIILLHDIHKSTVDAVPAIIKELKSQGYTFVTVEQLLLAKRGEYEALQVYRRG